MSNDSIILSNYKKAISSLEKALNTYERRRQASDYSPDEENLNKSGVIQNFEFTYELGWKLIRRWLNVNVSTDISENIMKRELFRIAKGNKLINDDRVWFTFHQLRNNSSHNYDEIISDDVFSESANLLTESKALLENIHTLKGDL